MRLYFALRAHSPIGNLSRLLVHFDIFLVQNGENIFNPREKFPSRPSVHKQQSYRFRFSSYAPIKALEGLKLRQNNQQNVANTVTTFPEPKTIKTTLKSQQIWYQFEAKIFGYQFKHTKNFSFIKLAARPPKITCPGSSRFLPTRPWGRYTVAAKNVGVVPKLTKNPQCVCLQIGECQLKKKSSL